MTMDREDRLFGTCSVFTDVFDQAAHLIRGRIADSIRQIDRRGAVGNGSFDDPAQEVQVAAGSVFG